MSLRSRALVWAPLLGVLTIVVSATAAGLYDYSDDELSGPEQPIEFSHRVHATDLGIECLYCHTSADKSQTASVPAVSVCMGCHQWVKEGSSPGSAEEIAKLHGYVERSESIPWIRVHSVPDHVRFKHEPHVLGGITCQRCHGPVEAMNRVWLVPDTVHNPSAAFLPAAKLEMGWCVDCHQQEKGPLECITCHY